MFTQRDTELLERSDFPKQVLEDLTELCSFRDGEPFPDPLHLFEMLQRKAIFFVPDQIKALQLSEGAIDIIESGYTHIFDHLLYKGFGFTLLEDPSMFFNKAMNQCYDAGQESINLESLGARVAAVNVFHGQYFKALFILLTQRYFSNI